MKKLILLSFTVAILSALAGCVTSQPKSTPQSPKPYETYDSGGSKAAPPKENLSGFPAEYRRGYTEGCQTAKNPRQRETRDDERFARDADYRMGWQDGFSICSPRG